MSVLVSGAGPAVVTLHDGAFLNTFLMNYCTDLNEKHLCHDVSVGVHCYMFY